MSKANLKAAWEQYMSQGQISSHVPGVIASSWTRCLEYKVDPLKPRHDILERHLLQQRVKANDAVIKAARPVMEDLYRLIRSTGLMVILTDAEGFVIHTLGNQSVLSLAQQVELMEGANWQESVKGTNAIGTALQEKSPVNVFAYQHFCENNHFLTCSAAPIFDPFGNVLGVLDVSGHYRSAHPLLLSLVIAAARSIEHHLVTDHKNHPGEHARLVQSPGGFVFPESPVCEPAFTPILGHSPLLLNAIRLAHRCSTSQATVLLRGESGTGKEVFAKAIHQSSSRACGPFVALNCGAIPESLVESELFGYEEGAFTGARKGGSPGKFELAHGGTLLLDEIGDMPLSIQASLLRVLQEQEVTRIGGRHPIRVDVRVIAATHKDLTQEVAKGKFRLDLYYRLNVVSIEIPPLAKRGDDVLVLAETFLQRLSCEGLTALNRISPAAANYLLSYSWPGNVRELENCLLRASHLADGNELLPEHLPDEIRTGSQNFYTPQLGSIAIPSDSIAFDGTTPFPDSSFNLKDVEIQTIRSAITHANGNLSKAAQLLGIGRNTLYRKLKEYGINA